ncbi:MAG: homocysteine S-methyltransferase [Selenomonadaceae bacterium]|nr:homocysteine S-methyltransferase [Selenomonadaceae bacterium]
MNIIINMLSRNFVMILDGALATELEKRGFNINDKLWSAKALIEAPDLIKSVHLDYLKAGANIITSASYQATIEGFMKHGLSHDKAVDLIKLSVELAKEACKEFKNKFVAASIGPYGAFLADGSEYRGDYLIGYNQLREFHDERMAILASTNPDLFACETIPCFVEARAIVDELKKYPKFCAWISFSCRDGKHISNGELIADCAAWLDTQSQVAAIGVNCTAPEYIESLIKEIRKSSSKPIIVYPNSGEVFDVQTETWQGSPVSFADYAKIWYETGARIIGGCCRTTPQTIQSISKAQWYQKIRNDYNENSYN